VALALRAVSIWPDLLLTFNAVIEGVELIQQCLLYGGFGEKCHQDSPSSSIRNGSMTKDRSSKGEFSGFSRLSSHF
jgi:hypothetical protein